MKITIDTKEDSHQEIRKIIRMLSSLVGEKEVMSNQSDIFSDDTGTEQSSDMFSDDSNQEKSNDMFSMFSSTPSQTTENKVEEEEKTEEEKKEDKENIDLGIPEFEEYD
tara:strand:- start:813 stop:1139 length:327 start_codon:yes stop_codon:yes gene_type:complete